MNLFYKMKTLREKFAHAFSVDRDSSAEQGQLPESLERLAEKVVSAGMEAPVLILFETLTPMNFLGAQLLYSIAPLLQLFTESSKLEEIAAALEDRRTLRTLCDRIEALSAVETV